MKTVSLRAFEDNLDKHVPQALGKRYNWTRPHQHNSLVPPAVVEEKLKSLSGNC